MDLVWLRGHINMTHLLIVAVFYLLWRLPGQNNSVMDDVVWYDAVQSLSETSSSHKSENVTAVESLSAVDEAYLQAQVPASTAAERWRFWTAKQQNLRATVQALRVYTAWRLQHAVEEEEDTTTTDATLTADELAWQRASVTALRSRQEARPTTPLPQLAHLHYADGGDHRRDGGGRRILHFLPGRMDDRVASTHAYATAVALYVDAVLPRDDTELVTVVIDARGGVGWRNLNAAQLLPFIQLLSKLMLTMFPQRLARCVVFPIPPRFFWVWRLARTCIDPATRDKIVPLSGPGLIESPPPLDKMAEYIGRENALFLESFRQARFL